MNFINSLQLFKATPDYNANIVIGLLIISIILILKGIIIWLLMKKISQKIPPYNELRNKLTSLLVTVGIIGLFLTLFAWQLIPYFSMRFLILLLVFVLIIWIISILIYIKREFSRELDKFKRTERYKKYLPKQKR
jgi:small-conductance mechanosensitive channel